MALCHQDNFQVVLEDEENNSTKNSDWFVNSVDFSSGDVLLLDFLKMNSPSHNLDGTGNAVDISESSDGLGKKGNNPDQGCSSNKQPARNSAILSAETDQLQQSITTIDHNTMLGAEKMPDGTRRDHGDHAISSEPKSIFQPELNLGNDDVSGFDLSLSPMCDFENMSSLLQNVIPDVNECDTSSQNYVEVAILKKSEETMSLEEMRIDEVPVSQLSDGHQFDEKPDFPLCPQKIVFQNHQNGRDKEIIQLITHQLTQTESPPNQKSPNRKKSSETEAPTSSQDVDRNVPHEKEYFLTEPFDLKMVVCLNNEPLTKEIDETHHGLLKTAASPLHESSNLISCSPQQYQNPDFNIIHQPQRLPHQLQQELHLNSQQQRSHCHKHKFHDQPQNQSEMQPPKDLDNNKSQPPPPCKQSRQLPPQNMAIDSSNWVSSTPSVKQCFQTGRKFENCKRQKNEQESEGNVARKFKSLPTLNSRHDPQQQSPTDSRTSDVFKRQFDEPGKRRVLPHQHQKNQKRSCDFNSRYSEGDDGSSQIIDDRQELAYDSSVSNLSFASSANKMKFPYYQSNRNRRSRENLVIHDDDFAVEKHQLMFRLDTWRKQFPDIIPELKKNIPFPVLKREFSKCERLIRVKKTVASWKMNLAHFYAFVECLMSKICQTFNIKFLKIEGFGRYHLKMIKSKLYDEMLHEISDTDMTPSILKHSNPMTKLILFVSMQSLFFFLSQVFIEDVNHAFQQTKHANGDI